MAVGCAGSAVRTQAQWGSSCSRLRLRSALSIHSLTLDKVSVLELARASSRISEPTPSQIRQSCRHRPCRYRTDPSPVVLRAAELPLIRIQAMDGVPRALEIFPREDTFAGLPESFENRVDNVAQLLFEFVTLDLYLSFVDELNLGIARSPSLPSQSIRRDSGMISRCGSMNPSPARQDCAGPRKPGLCWRRSSNSCQRCHQFATSHLGHLQQGTTTWLRWRWLRCPEPTSRPRFRP